MPSATRPSFSSNRQSISKIHKNAFGHTVSGDATRTTGISEEDLHITVDEMGNRSVHVDLFDSPAMKKFVAEQIANGTIVQEENGSTTVHAASTMPAEAAPVPRTAQSRPIGDPKSLEEFNEYMKAYNRGDDLSGVAMPEDEEHDARVVLSSTPPERSPLDIFKVQSYNQAQIYNTPHPTAPAVDPRLLDTFRSGSGAPDPDMTKWVLEAFPCGGGCGVSLTSVAKFCWSCGAAQKSKACAGCGFSFGGKERFCPDCGIARIGF